MGFIEVALIGVGLAMDAVAVSMTNGMIYKNLKSIDYIGMLAFFAGFQMLMPVVGYYAGSLFAGIMSAWSGLVILLILGIIGGKMIKEGIVHLREQQLPKDRVLTLGVLLFQAIATSIDALAVGLGFSFLGVPIGAAVAEIGIITAVMVLIAIYVGRKFGDLLGSKAEILGGTILVIIGIKAIL